MIDLEVSLPGKLKEGKRKIRLLDQTNLEMSYLLTYSDFSNP